MHSQSALRAYVNGEGVIDIITEHEADNEECAHNINVAAYFNR